ncbi:hypothetical protein WJX72_002820 [[Myrmecia] bisecta]|uniref:Uncharacterized protein n=1 Tax=[Myrmecia] bisecta TaxID=41462 RepID=A0AAW1PTT9_9CHLO
MSLHNLLLTGGDLVLELWQEWQVERGRGADLLRQIQARLACLQPSGTVLPIVLDLLKEAPSARFEAYVSNGCRKDTPAPDFADRLSADMSELHNILHRSQQLVQRLEAHTAPLQRAAMEALLLKRDHSLTDTRMQPPQEAAVDQVLLLVALAVALHKELALMEHVVSAVSLDMPLEELTTYICMWELQPFVDEEAIVAFQS